MRRVSSGKRAAISVMALLLLIFSSIAVVHVSGGADAGGLDSGA